MHVHKWTYMYIHVTHHNLHTCTCRLLYRKNEREYVCVCEWEMDEERGTKEGRQEQRGREDSPVLGTIIWFGWTCDISLALAGVLLISLSYWRMQCYSSELIAQGKTMNQDLKDRKETSLDYIYTCTCSTPSLYLSLPSSFSLFLPPFTWSRFIKEDQAWHVEELKGNTESSLLSTT